MVKKPSIFKPMLDLFREFDMYGTPAQIGIRGQTKANSIMGAIVSLLSIAGSLYLSSDSFFNMINATNPTITREIDFDNSILRLNSSNFDFNIAFFKPRFSSGQTFLSSSVNDYSYVTKFYNLNYTCYNCSGIRKNEVKIANLTNFDKAKCNGGSCIGIAPTEYKTLEGGMSLNRSLYNVSEQSYEISERQKFMMVRNDELKNKSKLDNISISSLSTKRANEVISLFKNYSYTFAENFTATILDDDPNNETAITNFLLGIPINSEQDPNRPGAISKPQIAPNKRNFRVIEDEINKIKSEMNKGIINKNFERNLQQIGITPLSPSIILVKN